MYRCPLDYKYDDERDAPIPCTLYTLDEIFDMFYERLESFGRTVVRSEIRPNLHSLVCFGSFARGESTAASDIDLLVIVKHHELVTPTRRFINRLLDDCEISFPEIDLVVKSIQAMEDPEMHDYFWEQIQKDGVTIWESKDP